VKATAYTESRAAQSARVRPNLHALNRPLQVKLSIVMPAYNEERTIRRAVEHVLAVTYPCEIELIVVNDGSSDNTAEMLEGFDDERLSIYSHVHNRGKGAALMTGIRVATGTHMLPFDADMEYSADDVPRLLHPIIAGRTEVVYGTRLFGANTVYHSFRYGFGNKAMTFMTNVLYDAFITDLHTCFKLVPLDVLRRIPLAESGFGLDTEITANVLKLGYRPFEVPISYYARSQDEGKKINWRDAVRCVQVLGRVRMQRTLTGAGGSLPVRHPSVAVYGNKVVRLPMNDLLEAAE
jgi:glycosyltransferase involved in cell wall biosynthesis